MARVLCPRAVSGVFETTGVPTGFGPPDTFSSAVIVLAHPVPRVVPQWLTTRTSTFTDFLPWVRPPHPVSGVLSGPSSTRVPCVGQDGQA